MTDIEVLRLHYADTLKAWRRRFNANRGRVAAIYDERFCRMWEFYLALCEAGFRHCALLPDSSEQTRGCGADDTRHPGARARHRASCRHTANERLGRRDMTVMAEMEHRIEQATAVLIAETNGIGKPSWAPCRRAPDLNRGRTR